MHRLENPVRDYAWGSPTVIPELLGVPADGTPQAELWIGAHADAPSRLLPDAPASPDSFASPDGLASPPAAGEETGAGGDTLADLIERDPTATLGAAAVSAFGARLPFLLKVLAVEEPLSLQAHPTRTQAIAGYAAEESAGVPADAPERTYKDDNHKPEMLWAVTDFEALCGFRPVRATVELLHALDVPGLRADVERLDSGDQDLAGLVRSWLELDTDQSRVLVAELASVCAGLAATSGPHSGEAGIIAGLAARHPDDAGVLVATLLNQVRLQPGQAVFLAAGNLHAYLHGTGVELMAASDNVLRGGMTSKHVDVEGLLRVLDARPGAPTVVDPVDTAIGTAYRVPVDDFELTVLRPGGGRAYDLPRGSPQLVLSIEGAAELTQDGAQLSLGRGQSVFVGADEPPVTVGGTGVVMRATTGGPFVRAADDGAG